MPTSRFTRFVRLDNDPGSDPDRLFPFSFNTARLPKPFSVDGIVPPTLFALTSKDVSDVSLPSDVGNDPTRPADPTPIDTTTPPTHVTPDHDDVVADEHTGPFLGLLPTHSQELNATVLDALNAADRSHIIESPSSSNDGLAVGLINGTTDGDALVTGLLEGTTDGDTDGATDGDDDGCDEGPDDGDVLGDTEGCCDGDAEQATIPALNVFELTEDRHAA